MGHPVHQHFIDLTTPFISFYDSPLPLIAVLISKAISWYNEAKEDLSRHEKPNAAAINQEKESCALEESKATKELKHITEEFNDHLDKASPVKMEPSPSIKGKDKMDILQSHALDLEITISHLGTLGPWVILHLLPQGFLIGNVTYVDISFFWVSF